MHQYPTSLADQIEDETYGPEVLAVLELELAQMRVLKALKEPDEPVYHYEPFVRRDGRVTANYIMDFKAWWEKHKK